MTSTSKVNYKIQSNKVDLELIYISQNKPEPFPMPGIPYFTLVRSSLSRILYANIIADYEKRV